MGDKNIFSPGIIFETNRRFQTQMSASNRNLQVGIGQENPQFHLCFLLIRMIRISDFQIKVKIYFEQI